jgi:hypothetical protein
MHNTHSPTVENEAEKYLEHIQRMVEFYKRKATAYRWFYNFERIAVIVLSLSLPVLPQLFDIARYHKIVPIVSVMIAILVALDGLFKPGELWRHFKSFELRLKRLRQNYETSRIDVSIEKAEGRKTELALVLYKRFVEDAEKLFESETNQFWPRRIQEMQQQPPQAG